MLCIIGFSPCLDPLLGMTQFFQLGPELIIITGHWVILARRSVQIDDHTCLSFAEPKARDKVAYESRFEGKWVLVTNMEFSAEQVALK